MSILSRLKLDPLILGLVAAALIASLFPLSEGPSDVLRQASQASVALLFFLHGARLRPQTMLEGLKNWKLHLTILCCTFVMFPLLAAPVSLLTPRFLSPELFIGFIYLCILPSTIQSSIAFTSLAGGNVAAAVVAASASNILGVVLTPLLAAVLLQGEGGVDLGAIERIAMQLLLPFVLGQLLQRWVGDWVRGHATLVRFVERASIISVAFLAFSDAMVAGAWSQIGGSDLLVLLILVVTLLATVLFLTRNIARLLGFNKEDEIAIMFCGSKKSMGSGLPMANIIFAGQPMGLLILPMMIYHQIQLIVCAVLSQAYANRRAPEGGTTPAE